MKVPSGRFAVIGLPLVCIWLFAVMTSAAERTASSDNSTPNSTGLDKDPDRLVAASEALRIAAIKKVHPAVVAVCMHGGQGVGSGVLISPDGFALTNYHVVQPTGPIMQAGLANGVLYDAVLVGTDKVGDVALIKLFPKKPGEPFPFVELGDSDKVRPGDWSLAMGNPFSLAMDFTPTVTFGIVSGTNRYQPPEGRGLLEYTDCIQIETSINPGNSGGPLFNMQGELIGINGRGSFEKRGRVNSGVGYAISINQIKNFLGHLKAGLETDHATLGAEIRTAEEDGDLNRMIVSQILEESDAYRRGLREGDQLVSFAGRPLTSTNQFKNILGIFPKEWRLPLVYRRGDERREVLVRLMGHMAQEKGSADIPEQVPPAPKIIPKKGPVNSPVAKYYQAKPGFANYYYNEQAQKAILDAFTKQGDFTSFQGNWSAEGRFDLGDRRGDMKFQIIQPQGDESSPTVKLNFNVPYSLQPLNENASGEFREPLGSGGLLIALYQYHRLLTQGSKGFKEFSAGGTEPIYPPSANEEKRVFGPRVDADVIRTQHASVDVKWYFSKTDGRLLGFETFISKNEDPCEVYLSDYKPVDGRLLPHRYDIRHGDKRYGTLMIQSYSWKEKS